MVRDLRTCTDSKHLQICLQARRVAQLRLEKRTSATQSFELPGQRRLCILKHVLDDLDMPQHMSPGGVL